MDEKNNSPLPRLSACALGVAAGITWGLGLLILAILAKYLDIGGALVNAIATVYIGFNLTPLGMLIGICWGLLDGFITGFIFALIYNFALKHCFCKRCRPERKAD